MKAIIFYGAALLSVGLFCSNCNGRSGEKKDSTYVNYDHQKVPYRFYQPDTVLNLAKALTEISGLSIYEGQLAAVEDEHGILYILSPQDGKVLREIKFAGKGDFEAVEIVDNIVYVIKSNGELYSFAFPQVGSIDADIMATDLSQKNDVEGLGYDGTVLLIACKEEGEVSDNSVKGKAVYPFDLREKKLMVKAGFTVRNHDLENVTTDTGDFRWYKNFTPSAIAVHPGNADRYMLSSNKVLVVLGPDNKVKEAIRLSPEMYYQPEGICFAADGTLYISSEGGEGNQGKIFRVSLIGNK